MSQVSLLIEAELITLAASLRVKTFQGYVGLCILDSFNHTPALNCAHTPKERVSTSPQMFLHCLKENGLANIFNTHTHIHTQAVSTPPDSL